MNAKTKKLGLSTSVSLLITLSASNAFGALGPLSDTPLFVTTAVEPNVFLTLDDSGSMDWEALVPNSGDFPWYNGVTSENGDWQAYLHPGWEDYQYYSYDSYNDRDRNIIPPAGYSNTSSDAYIQSFWVMQNHNYNKIYYNPATTYSPWPGIDEDTGLPFTDADITNILRDPTRKTYSTSDLTQNFDYYDNIDTGSLIPNIAYLPSYYTWTDDNGNGTVEVDEPHTLIEIRPTTTTYPSGRSYAEEIQNFANWFQYYRKREFATKATIGGVIYKETGTRMGLRLINGGHRENLASMSDSSNKQNLLDRFYGINSNSGTPLRRALKYTGQMYQSSSYNGDYAILPAADGGECQQNFTILMTDGFWNGYSPDVGNADRSTDSTGFDGDQTESNDGGNYEDNSDNTLADVAMYFYERDLRGDLANRVPTTPGVDLAEHQHMVTYTVSFGLSGTLDPETYDPLATGFSWPIPNNDTRKVDDLLHAAYNGRGLYLSANNPVELESALKAALEDIDERKATSSAVSVTSARLTTESVVYVSEFNTNGWQGTIYAYPIVEDADGLLSLDLTNPTEAAHALAAQVDGSGYNSRTVLTMDDGASGGSEGVPFRWDNLTDAMKADLRVNPQGNNDSDTIAQARLDYLRGDNSNEGQGYQFRERSKITVGGSELTNVLGDIVHSGPVYVAKPNLNWPDEAPFPTGSNAYSEYKEGQENRDGFIYVGANDGMVHGFRESDMQEVLAYIPSNLFSTDTDQGLHYLTNPDYLHRYYNDLTPTVSDIYIDSGTGPAWHTVVVAGQRGGGRGYSALNVTNPSSFSEANAENIVMWEFNSDDDADLGYTFSRVQIGMTNDNEWVAIFGNGYNSDGDGQAKLFIVKIEEGIDGTWVASDYTKISTGTGSVANPNGLATPALADLDGNGTIDRAYAGDLNGDLWAFDLSASATTGWTLAYGSNPLFNTIDNRPITTQPALSFHPSVSTTNSNEPNVMVAVGSGQYMVDGDKNSTHDNYFYGIWDHGSSNLTSSNLVEQTFRSGFTDRVLTQNPVSYSTNDHGWFISLVDSGERAVTNPIIRSGYVYFNTNVPSADACSSGGYGYRFVVDLETGGTPEEPVVDTDQTPGTVDDGDTIDGTNVRSAERFERLLTDDTITQRHLLNQRELRAVRDAPTRSTGRISWQELLQ